MVGIDYVFFFDVEWFGEIDIFCVEGVLKVIVCCGNDFVESGWVFVVMINFDYGFEIDWVYCFVDVVFGYGGVVWYFCFFELLLLGFGVFFNEFVCCGIG